MNAKEEWVFEYLILIGSGFLLVGAVLLIADTLLNSASAFCIQKGFNFGHQIPGGCYSCRQYEEFKKCIPETTTCRIEERVVRQDVFCFEEVDK